MKKAIAIVLTVMGVTAAGTSARAAEEAYIPWTFDDFDSNGNVVETTEDQAVELSAAALETADDEGTGELGW